MAPRGGATYGLGSHAAACGGGVGPTGMGRAWQALRALRLRLLGPAKELVGTDQFGNKYYRVPQHQTGAGRHGVSPQVASLWPGLSAVVQPAAARVVRRPRRGWC